MTNYLVAALMWLLVLILSLRARVRVDNSMLKAAMVIAASVSTNINAVYLWAAELFPWDNALDLVSNILLIAGVFYLSRAIVHGATGGTIRNRGGAWGQAAAAATVAVMVISFALIDDPQPSTRFMLDYGDQPAAAVYSGVQYVFIFAVLAATLATCVRNVPRMRRRRFRTAFSIIGAGCGVGLLLCASVIVMDIAHVTGHDDVMRAVGGAYDVLYPLTITLLVIGLAVPPAGKVLNDRKTARRIRVLEPQVQAVWARTVARNPGVSLPVATPAAAAADPRRTNRSAVDAIHRLVIEIHDCTALSGNSAEGVSAADAVVLQEAEKLCLKQGHKL